ncbi:MAG: tetratricopeptide repeat protein [Flavobacterium sp.]
MKTNKIQHISLFFLTVFFVACSTKKDKFVNRQFQALNTRYNVLYNGNIALNDGINELKTQYKDDFWKVLPVERMQAKDLGLLPGESKNANFVKAEEKATKAIQKRSMNIGGRERNSQIDESYLLLGKARYYDGRFIPAQEAFNYILNKYPDSDKINEARIWREKTNMRLENDATAVNHLKELLRDKNVKLNSQVYADANAALAQAYLNMEEPKKALVCLKISDQYTKQKEEKARYRYIMGQLYGQFGQKDSSYAAYQSVIDMKRKSPRVYIIHALGEQAKQKDFKEVDSLTFVKKYKALIKDEENKPYLDVLYHQMALFYESRNDKDFATIYYRKSIKAKTEDQYLLASNYKNLAKINFDRAKYVVAGKYYDSTLVNLTPRTREYNYVKRKRENLEDVIKYEEIAHKNDSILSVVAMSSQEQKQYYEQHALSVKKSDSAKENLKKQQEAKAQGGDMVGGTPPGFGTSPSTAAGGASTFYFYNPSTIAYGKVEFKKVWGDRTYKENWRISTVNLGANTVNTDDTENTDAVVEENIKKEEKAKEKETNPKYNPEFYLDKLPKNEFEIATIKKDRDFAYYQLGIIYKEKFTEYELAAAKLELLLTKNPEERLVLPAMYNLYKIYEIINKEKALAMKNKIISQYPNSRYASILNNQSVTTEVRNDSPEAAYVALYKLYNQGDYFAVLDGATVAINQFVGDEIVPKMELLKAHTIGKINGLTEYKAALNFVALNYPNSPEGKEAESLIAKNIPVLEAMNFTKKDSKYWKIIYYVSDAKNQEALLAESKLKKFASERTTDKLKFSKDIYSPTENILVIHGISSESKAKDIASILKEYKDYNINIPAIVISAENYTVIQIKKNLKAYSDFANNTQVPAGRPAPVMNDVPPAPSSPKPPMPQQANPQLPKKP